MTTIPLNTVESSSFVLELIYRLKIKDAMTERLITAGKGDSLRQIQHLMKENGITGVPAVDQKRLIGIISVDDIIRALDGGYIEDPVEQHMSRNLIVLEDDMPLSFGISYFEKYPYGRFPVLNREKELVGIITSRDILVCLLMEINREVERLEQLIPAEESTSPEGNMRKDFRVRKYDFENAGRASTEIRKILKTRDLDPRLVRRVAVASYELEMNLVVHSVGGTISFRMDPERIVIVARDRGPGIADPLRAQEEGFSTANEWIRSLGFGAGMGLPNVKRVSDDFTLESGAERGTVVTSVIRLAGTPKEGTTA